jgi:phage regulator Rha-like protein
LNNLIDSYKNDWDEILKDLKVKWKEYITEAGYKLEKLYNEKKEELGDFKDIAPQKVDELKNNLISGFEDLKTQIKQKNK